MPYSNIDKPSSYFNTVLYTGNITAPRTITGVGFNPDLVWVKDRSNANWHFLSDTVRGSNKNLATNATDAEANPTTYGNGGIGTPTTDGFTIVSGTTNSGNVNTNGSLYTSWNWLANGAGVSNTQGSITSTVSANTTSGFSIGTYTGNGTAGATIGHGLNSDKVTIIIKRRDTTSNWAVKHYKIPATQWLQLDQTDGANTASVIWNNTEPDVDKFTVGSYVGTNASGGTYVFYAFAEVKGYSKFGSYTGNGSADGTFVYTGFKPAFVMIKQTNAGTEHWTIRDNKRQSFNLELKTLFANLSNAENTGSTYGVDLLSNGFKCRDADVACNSSGSSYIYMAFAENPFVSSKGIPTTAR